MSKKLEDVQNEFIISMIDFFKNFKFDNKETNISPISENRPNASGERATITISYNRKKLLQNLKLEELNFLVIKPHKKDDFEFSSIIITLKCVKGFLKRNKIIRGHIWLHKSPYKELTLSKLAISRDLDSFGERLLLVLKEILDKENIKIDNNAYNSAHDKNFLELEPVFPKDKYKLKKNL